MSDLVDPQEIERIVGIRRHPTEHYGAAVSAERKVYILHSEECLATYSDLRDCPFSLALDRGINLDEWIEDTPTRLAVRLVPA